MAIHRPATDRTGAPARPARRGSPPGWQVWLGLWIVYVVWGSTYLAIRVLIETFPPLLSAGVRFLLAGAILQAWVRIRHGRAAVPLSRRQLASTALVGTLLLAGGNGLVTLGERTVPSGLTALVIGSVPLWVVLFRALARERVGAATLVGVAIGFVGLAVLLLPGARTGGASAAGLLFVVFAAASWAAGSFSATRLSMPSEPLRSTALQMLCGGAVMALAGLAHGEAASVDVGRFSLASSAAFVYLVLAGSLLAFTAYAWLLQNAPLSKVATYAYVNPVIAVFLGWLLLTEPVTASTIVGAAIIVASVAFIVGRATPGAGSSLVRDDLPPGAEPALDRRAA